MVKNRNVKNKEFIEIPCPKYKKKGHIKSDCSLKNISFNDGESMVIKCTDEKFQCLYIVVMVVVY
jgi:hypothetical protein